MKQHYHRFECVQDQDGTWKVWDTCRGEPAELSGQVLINKPQYRAEGACMVLNQIYAGGLQRRDE